MDYVNEKIDKKLKENPGYRQNLVRQTQDQIVGEIVQENRGEFFKRSLMYKIAAELRAHRMHDSGYRIYKGAEIEAIYEFLGHFAGDVEYSQDSLAKSGRKGHFFTKKDIQWIRMASGTGLWRLYFSEVFGEVFFEGFVGGLFGSFGKFFSSLDKVS